MKKILLGISMMLLSAISFTAAAQTQEAKQCAKETCKQEQCDKAKKCDKKGECDKAAKKCDKAGKQCEKVGKQCDKAAVCGKEAKKCCKGDSAARCPKGDKKIGFRHGMGDSKQISHGKGLRGGRERLFEGIELNETQKAQLEALDKKMAEDRKALKDSEVARGAEAKAEAKAAGKKAREEYNLALKEILTEEQYAKYEANRDAMKVRMEAKKDFRNMKSDIRVKRPAVEKSESK